MTTADPGRATIPRGEHLGASLAISWLLSGSVLVATVVLTGGWRLVAAIWLASALLFGLLLLQDLLAERT